MRFSFSAFEESANEFLKDSGKRLDLSTRTDELSQDFRGRAGVVIRRRDGKSPVSLTGLSSGERHVLTLLFSVTHMSDTDGLVLIDEPELSLHVDWQRQILGEMCKQTGERQVIACTHAPEVAANHLDSLVALQAVDAPLADSELTDDSEGIDE